MFTPEQTARIIQWSTVLGLDIRGVRDISAIRPFELQLRAMREEGFKGRMSDDRGMLYLFEDKFTSSNLESIDNVIFYHALEAEGFRGVLGRDYPLFCGLVCESASADDIKDASAELGIDAGGAKGRIAIAEELLRRNAEYMIHAGGHTTRLYNVAFSRAVDILRPRIGFGDSEFRNSGQFLKAFLDHETFLIRESLKGLPEGRLAAQAALLAATAGGKHRMINLGETSEELCSAGIDATLLKMSSLLAQSKDAKHSLNLPELIADGLIGRIQKPLAVLSSWSKSGTSDQTQRRYMVLTGIPFADNENRGEPSTIVAIISCRNDNVRNAEVISIYPKSNAELANRLACDITAQTAEKRVLYASDEFFESFLPELDKITDRELDNADRKRAGMNGVKEKRPRFNSGSNSRIAAARPNRIDANIASFLKYRLKDKKKIKKNDISFSVDEEKVFAVVPPSPPTSPGNTKDPDGTAIRKRSLDSPLKESDFSGQNTYAALRALNIKTVRDLMSRESIVATKAKSYVVRDVKKFLAPYRKASRPQSPGRSFSVGDCRRMAENIFSLENVKEVYGQEDGICRVTTDEGMNGFSLLTGRPLLKRSVELLFPPYDGWAMFEYVTPEGRPQYNYVNSRCEFLAMEPFDGAESFNRGKARVRRDNTIYTIDTKGTVKDILVIPGKAESKKEEESLTVSKTKH